MIAAVLIRRVYGPDEWMVVRAGTGRCGGCSCAVVDEGVICGEGSDCDCDEESRVRCASSGIRTLRGPHTTEAFLIDRLIGAVPLSHAHTQKKPVTRPDVREQARQTAAV